MSSSNDSFPHHGLVVAGDDEQPDKWSGLTHAILDDCFYNILHDILLKTHRDEKIARASTAAIIVEQKAAESDPNPNDDSGSAFGQLSKVDTPAALYKDGEVYLKGNPLKTIEEIRCGKCGLPRLLRPTDGLGAEKPDPSIEYCKRKPFIEKNGFDIYGQTFQPEGPGRGKKKQPNPLLANADALGGSGSEASKPINFPHAKCHHCNTFLPIKRMNNHMAKCIGGGGRNSSRMAWDKIQNSNGTGSQNGSTPPASRNATPIPGSGSQSKGKSSPQKREPEDYDTDESPEKKKTKPIKNKLSGGTVHITVKPKLDKLGKSSSQQSSSRLKHEQKASHSNDDESDDDDGDYGSTSVEASKKKTIIKTKPKGSSSKNGTSNSDPRRDRWLMGRGGGGTIKKLKNTPKIDPPDNSARNNGNARRAASESSQTLSSPN